MQIQEFISEEKIRARVKELGRDISALYAGQPLLVVGVLKGAFIFVADLLRALNLPVSVEFMGVSSYQGTQSTGHVRITHDLSVEIKNRHVLLVEDIIDTGITIDYLMSTLEVREPASLRICSLLSKPTRHTMQHRLDFVGFEIDDEFVVGYGLDLDERYRELPFVAKMIQG